MRPATGLVVVRSLMCGVTPLEAKAISFRWSTLAAVVVAVGLVSGSAEGASFTRLGALDDNGYSVPMAVSTDGSTVVGYNGRAFIWDQSNGFREIFGLQANFGSNAVGVLADGSTVVGNDDQGPFIWDEVNGRRSIDPLSGSLSYISDVSADGSTFLGGNGDSGAVTWDAVNGTLALGNLPGGNSLAALSLSADGSTVVGRDITETGEEAFIWDAVNGMQGLGVLPGGAYGMGGGSAALGVSADGSIVVGGSTSALGQEAFVWDAVNGMRGLGDLQVDGLFDSLATDVSADGSIVVGVGASGTFIWDAANGMRDLDVLLTALGLDLSGWDLRQIIYAREMPRISADGRTIVGTGYYQGQRTAYVAVIPEASTALLLGMGLVGLAANGVRLSCIEKTGPPGE